MSLVETATLVSVVGMLLAVALPTLSRTVRASKVAEASEQLDNLYRASAAYYAEARTLGGSPGSQHCLPAPAGPTPELPSSSPRAADFGAAEVKGAETWKALAFLPQTALRYRYWFMPSSSGCHLPSGATLTLRAEGDLDGDGVYSHFERRAKILADGQLQPEPVLHIEDRIE